MVPMAASVTFALGLAFALVLALGAVEPAQLLLPGSASDSAPLLAADFPDYKMHRHGGYDGQQYYAIAATLPGLSDATPYLDAPRYRLERILAPAIASLAPRGAPTVLVLLALNVLGTGLACGAVAELCTTRGWNPRLGLVALPPLLVALATSCIDPMATGLALGGLVLVERRRYVAAALLLGAGALTREGVAFLIAGIALAVLLEVRSWRGPLVLASSVLPLAAWHWYLSVEVGGTFQSKVALLAIRERPLGAALLTLGCFGVCTYGAYAWRHRPAIAAVCVITAVQIPFFAPDILDWAALPRVTAVGLSLGLAALGAPILRRVRSPALTVA